MGLLYGYVQKLGLEDETIITRPSQDCNLLGAVESTCHKIFAKQGILPSMTIKRHPKPDSHFSRQYHVFVYGLKTFELEDEELFCLPPILFAQPSIRTHIYTSQPRQVVFWEIVLHILDRPSGIHNVPLGMEQMGRMFMSFGTMNRTILSQARNAPNPAHFAPMGRVHEDQKFQPEGQEGEEDIVMMAPPPAVASTSMFTKAWACIRPKDSPRPTSNMQPPLVRRPSMSTPPIVNLSSKGPPAKPMTADPSFPCGLPRHLEPARILDISDMVLTDRKIYENLKQIVEHLWDIRTTTLFHTQSPTLQVGLGMAHAFRYYCLYVSGFEVVYTEHKRLFAQFDPAKVTHVSVDGYSKCLMITWLAHEEPVESVWVHRSQSEHMDHMMHPYQVQPTSLIWPRPAPLTTIPESPMSATMTTPSSFQFLNSASSQAEAEESSLELMFGSSLARSLAKSTEAAPSPTVSVVAASSSYDRRVSREAELSGRDVASVPSTPTTSPRLLPTVPIVTPAPPVIEHKNEGLLAMIKEAIVPASTPGKPPAPPIDMDVFDSPRHNHPPAPTPLPPLPPSPAPQPTTKPVPTKPTFLTPLVSRDASDDESDDAESERKARDRERRRRERKSSQSRKRKDSSGSAQTTSLKKPTLIQTLTNDGSNKHQRTIVHKPLTTAPAPVRPPPATTPRPTTLTKPRSFKDIKPN